MDPEDEARFDELYDNTYPPERYEERRWLRLMAWPFRALVRLWSDPNATIGATPPQDSQ